jgi:hypothetical protein
VPPAAPAPAAAPAPTAPQWPEAAAPLAAATVAAAEVPRRAAARRSTSSRGQAQRAATTRVARLEQAEPQPQLAVAGANPFTPEAAPITTRPWPRALLPNAGGAFNVGYGNLQPFPRDTHPFRPAPVDEAGAQPQASQPQAPVPSPR